MTLKERIKQAWWVLTHKSRGHEFFGSIIITDEGWAERGEEFTESIRRECDHLARDLRRHIFAEKQKELRFEEI